MGPTALLQIVHLQVDAPQTAAFERRFEREQKHIACCEGYVTHELQHNTRIATRYALLVEWSTPHRPEIEDWLPAALTCFLTRPPDVGWYRFVTGKGARDPDPELRVTD